MARCRRHLELDEIDLAAMEANAAVEDAEVRTNATVACLLMLELRAGGNQFLHGKVSLSFVRVYASA